jgi:hypothetical protein
MSAESTTRSPVELFSRLSVYYDSSSTAVRALDHGVTTALHDLDELHRQTGLEQPSVREHMLSIQKDLESISDRFAWLRNSVNQTSPTMTASSASTASPPRADAMAGDVNEATRTAPEAKEETPPTTQQPLALQIPSIPPTPQPATPEARPLDDFFLNLGQSYPSVDERDERRAELTEIANIKQTVGRLQATIDNMPAPARPPAVGAVTITIGDIGNNAKVRINSGNRVAPAATNNPSPRPAAASLRRPTSPRPAGRPAPRHASRPIPPPLFPPKPAPAPALDEEERQKLVRRVFKALAKALPKPVISAVLDDIREAE